MTLLVWGLTCVIWSTVWLFIKLGVTDVPPITFAAARLFVAFSVLAPITIARRVPLPSHDRDWLLIAGTGVLLLGANYAAVYWGAQFISSGMTAVLQAMTPAFGLVLGHLFLADERITAVKAGALTLGVFGVAVIFADQLQFAGWRSFWGSASVLVGSIFVAVAYVAMKKRGQHLSPSLITAGQMLAALAPLSTLAIVAEGSPLDIEWSGTAVVSLLYLSLVGSVLGTWLNYWLLKRMSATKVLTMALVEPPLAMLLGAAVLDETTSSRALAGTICILVSVAVILELVPFLKLKTKN